MQRTFYGTNDYLTNTKLTGDTTNGFTLLFPDGSQNVYGEVVTNSDGSFFGAFLTQAVNSQGQKTTFNYGVYLSSVPSVQLQTVVDGDGRTNFLYYATSNYYSTNLMTNLISKVVDPFGRTNTLEYDTNGFLTNITDVAGLTSAFTYDTNDVVSSLTTPYGTTSFNVVANTASNIVPPNGRSILVTQPDGGQQLFLYEDSAPGVASSYATNQVPVTSPFTNTLENTNLNLRNSFYWDPRQYANLSTTNISSLISNDFRLARMRHWLQATDSLVGLTLSLERNPSPDAGGTIEGQKTWYDYASKTNVAYEGTQFDPLLTARVLPDGTTSFTRADRNSIGNVLTNISTCSSNGSVGFRTNLYTYDSTNGIDLLISTNALGVQVSSNSYNFHHEVLTNYDALNEMTAYTYNASQQVLSIAYPNGLITTNIYQSDGQLATNYGFAVAGGGTGYFGTNIYTYSNDLVATHTDERGLITTNLYDNLQRLTNAADARGAMTYFYSNLDLVQVVDRLGFTNSFIYDQMRRMTNKTDALGHATTYNYCTCGSLDSIQDPLGNITYLYYNNAGWLTNAVYPAGYSVTNNYDLLGRMTNMVDSSGSSVTNWFNNQSLKYAVSNAFGQGSFAIFDLLDRVATNIDANGVTITNSYDHLNRILTRTYPDTGVEQFFYTTNGLVAYTNQLTNATSYAYDAEGRKIAETNANNEVTQFSYDSAGDLVTLTDGKNQTTTWNYDQFGRVTNKVDAATNVILIYKYDADNRLTNRWSTAKTNTFYSYDVVGNLTNVTYPTNHSISMAYDADNRLTNMVDGIGTTSYGYDGLGELLSEGGLWSDDTVSYTYNNWLRSSVSVTQPNADSWMQTYAYDGARRLTNTTSPAGSFGYAYNATCNLLVSNLALPNGASITNSYDGNARLLATVLMNSGNTVLNSHSYTYNVGNQRTQQTFTASNYVNYAYDNIGQLTNANGKEPGGVTNRLLEQLSYVYDAAHNLNIRNNNAMGDHFFVNSRNELTESTYVGTLTVEGTTGASATEVDVDGGPARRAVLYSDHTFAKAGLTVTNGTNTITAVATDALGRHSTNVVVAYFPNFNFNFSNDLNGNLLYDGLRAFAYDDENQLISVTVTNAWQSQFVYDGRLRRRIRKEFTWSSASTNWIQTNEVHYIYDGNVVVQERDINNLAVTTYTRGRDLSGFLQGAGGIGGMLAMSQPSTVNPQHFYYHADGNGNITAMVNAQQIIVAKYLYDPFGNTLAMAGPLAGINFYRFSSKEYHQNSGLAYYLCRFYDPNLQRWVNRDPIGEDGGVNLFGYVFNDAPDLADVYGLQPGVGVTIAATGTTAEAGASTSVTTSLTVGGGTAYTPTVTVSGSTAGGGALGGGALLGIAVTGAAIDVGLIAYDLHLMNQLNDLNDQMQQQQQALSQQAQRRREWRAYHNRCDEDPPSGLDPCALSRWLLQQKLDCKKMRQDFTNKYFGGSYDWGHQRYMDILDSEIGALEDWIKQNCCHGQGSSQK